MIHAESNLLALVLLFSPVVVVVAGIVMSGVWLRHRESRSLFVMAGGLDALAVGQFGWTVLIGAGLMGIALPVEFQTWTLGLSALMPVALAAAFLVLYFTGWLGQRS